MQAQIEEFKKEIEGYSREGLLALCLDLKQKQLEDAVVIAEFQNAAPAMSREYLRIKEQLAKVKEERDSLEKKYKHACGLLAVEKNHHFGTHSEQASSLGGLDPDSLHDLLDEDLDPAASTQEPRDGGKKKQAPGKDGVDAEIRKALRKLCRLMYGPHEKKKRDFSRLPHRDTFLLDMEEYDRMFGEGAWEIASWHSKELLHRLPTEYYVEVRHVPVIKSRETGQMVSFPMPGVMRGHSPVTPSVLAHLFYEKAFMAAPVNRISDDMENQGCTLSRQTLNSWVLEYAETHLAVASDFMEKTLRGYGYNQGDESTLQVILDGRKAGSKGYMWVHTSSELDPVHPIAVFRFELTRGTDHLRRFYKACALFLTCDAYSPYGVVEKESGGAITVTGCFMHARRRFFIAFLLRTSGLSEEQWQELPEYRAILLIADIYLAENELRTLSPEERLQRRQTEVRPAVDAFFEFVHSYDSTDPAASEKMKDAVSYSLNQESRLRKFLEDGHVPIDNGFCERILRRYAIGRRNWLFCNTQRGADALGIIYTIVETARLNGANPLLYLEFLLEKTPEYMDITDRSRLEELMPWSDQWGKYMEEKIHSRIDQMLPPSQEKPHYRPYQKKNQNKTSSDGQAAG